MHLRPKWYPKAALAILALLALVACTSATPTSPTFTPTPSTPYWPTYQDFDMVTLPKSLVSPDVGNVYGVIRQNYPALAAIYVASECFAGNPLTQEGFRTFVGQTLEQVLVMNQTVAYASVAAQAREVAGKLLALKGKDVRGSCIEPFLYPKTGAEAQLGSALFEIPLTEYLRRTEGAVGAYYVIQRGIVTLTVAQWFQLEAKKSRDPFVPWLWANPKFDVALEPLAQIPGGVPVPNGATRLPVTWAMDYQLSVLQMVNKQQANEITKLCSQVMTLSGRGFFC